MLGSHTPTPPIAPPVVATSQVVAPPVVNANTSSAPHATPPALPDPPPQCTEVGFGRELTVGGICLVVGLLGGLLLASEFFGEEKSTSGTRTAQQNDATLTTPAMQSRGRRVDFAPRRFDDPTIRPALATTPIEMESVATESTPLKETPAVTEDVVDAVTEDVAVVTLLPTPELVALASPDPTVEADIEATPVTAVSQLAMVDPKDEGVPEHRVLESLKTLANLDVPTILAPPLPCPDGTCQAGMESHGTTLKWADTPADAYRMADEQNKLVYLIHVSGNFEIPGFT